MTFRCPYCRQGTMPLTAIDSPGWTCPQCRQVSPHANGITDGLTPERAANYARFTDDYLTIRKAEGRGSDDPSYYRELPFGKRARPRWQWAMRAKTYRYLERRVLSPLAADAGRPLRALDLGAGNGWLSNRLAQMGHEPVAVDLLRDDLDGLGACRHYETSFLRIRADSADLPLDDDQFDLAIFNASFHYAVDYWKALQEVRRCLCWGGRVLILDTPIYADWPDGEAMVEERHALFERQYGFRSDSVHSMEYLHFAMIRDLAQDLNIRWTFHRPWYGWAWRLRPLKAKLAGKRTPSRFWILEGAWLQQ